MKIHIEQGFHDGDSVIAVIKYKDKQIVGQLLMDSGSQRSVLTFESYVKLGMGTKESFKDVCCENVTTGSGETTYGLVPDVTITLHDKAPGDASDDLSETLSVWVHDVKIPEVYAGLLGADFFEGKNYGFIHEGGSKYLTIDDGVQ